LVKVDGDRFADAVLASGKTRRVVIAAGDPMDDLAPRTPAARTLRGRE
jgi:hypothetical protein